LKREQDRSKHGTLEFADPNWIFLIKENGLSELTVVEWMDIAANHQSMLGAAVMCQCLSTHIRDHYQQQRNNKTGASQRDPRQTGREGSPQDTRSACNFARALLRDF